MRRKFYLLIVAATLLLASCGKDPIPGEDPVDEPVRFSVLGDSYSTFVGYVDPESNDIWYDTMPNNHTDVTSVEQMWWYKVANAMEWSVEKNNSFSGSLISNFSDFEAGNYYAPNSFLRRMDNLGNPDVIFILGGTNDVWQDAPFGDYVYEDWTEEQLCSFRPALAYLLGYTIQQYPKAKIYFLLETSPCPGGITEETRLNLIESTHRITSHYGVDCIDLEIHKDWWHPDVKGQNDIARQVLEVLERDFNV